MKGTRKTVAGVLVGMSILVGLASGSPAAEEVVFEDEAWRSLEPHQDSRCVVTGDLDLDGDLDLVFGDGQGIIRVFFNAWGRSLDRVPRALAVGPVSPVTSISLGDLNGDGYPELVVGHELAPLSVYRNVAGDFPAAPETLGLPLEVADLVLADMDNDRDLDLVVGANGENNRWLPNVEGSLLPEQTQYFGPSDQTRSIAVGDLDQDGWLDLFTANAGGLQRIFYNRSGDLTADQDSLPFDNVVPTVTAMGDISSDGLMDLVVFTSLNRVRVYVNNGDRTFSIVEAGAGSGDATDVALADLDADGHLDVVYTMVSSTEPVAWLRFRNGAWLTPHEVLGNLVPNGISGGMTGLALGDLDEDGDLDVVGASKSGAAEAVLWRSGGILESQASWPGAGSWAANDNGTTYGLAMADLNLDGFLDVVQGRFGEESLEASSIYLNQDGVMGAEPDQWTSTPTSTTSLVVADWDGNGYPDLLFGHKDDGAIHLHRNLNGTIDPTPEELILSPTNVWSLAVVDLDNDGRNDLVEGGVGELRISLRNPAGTGFRSTTAIDLGQAAGFCNYLDFADVDNDGDLDFALAQSNGLEMVFRNNFPAGVLPETLWLAPSIQIGGFISLADLDGDHQPDLTVGYAGTTVDNEWFRGNAGNFDDLGRPWGDNEFPTWQAEMSDWDGDGYPDLLEAEENGANRLLKNRFGVIDKVARALWKSSDAARTYRLAAGDLDHDGDLDLWVGNRLEPDQIFRGVLNPGPTNPDGAAPPLKPGSPAYLRSLSVSSEAANLVGVECRAVDREEDDLVVLARFRPADSVVWLPLEDHFLSTSAEGLAQELTFDSSAWPASPTGYVLQFRTVEISRRLADVRHAPRYEITLASAGISRPEMVLPRRDLVMPTLTEGGYSETSFTVTNAGNEVLQISGVSSRPDMVLDPATTSLDPGETMTLGLSLSPLENIPDGFVILSSNDPLSPADTVMVTTDIRPLAFGFNFLLEGGAARAPLGESLTGLLAPADGVDMDEGWFHYRPAGAATFATLSLSSLENDWVAVIPGSDVTEAGIEYYLEVRNGAKTVTDPAANPQANPYLLEVEPPTGMSSLVQAHSDAGIISNRDIFIRVVPPPGTILHQRAVHFRVGGAQEFQTAILQSDSTLLIPASAVGARGLEYHVAALSLNAELRDPPVGEHQIRVNVANLAEPTAAWAKKYRMVSVPLDFGDFSGTIGDLVGDQPEFGPYDITRWRCFRYLPDMGRYGELSQADLEEVFLPAPGKAFWLIASEANRLNTSPVTGRSVPGGESFTMEVAPGWNQVANPFAFPVAWSSVSVTYLSGESAETELSGPISGGLQSLTVLQPFSGFWVKNFHDEDLQIHFSPVAQEEEKAGNGADPSWDWALELKVDAGSFGSASATAAVAPQGRAEWDPLDQPLAPSAPDQKLRIYLTNGDWASHAGSYSRDVRPVPEATEKEGWSWAFEIDILSSDPEAAEANLTLEGLTLLPENYRAVLIDRELRQNVPISASSGYSLVVKKAQQGSGPGRFLLAVGSDQYLLRAQDELGQLPVGRTALLQNAPNPFNPSTVIHYELAQPGSVRLNIYDLRGLRVRDLVADTQSSGRYQVLWDGRDNLGAAAGAGVYFARLEAAGASTSTIKMILVK